MTRDTEIVLKKNLDVTDLAGDKVMIDFESGKYFMIKGVGNDIWDMIQEKTTVGAIIDGLLKEYEVPEDVCEREVIAFLEKMASYEFI